MQATEAAPIKNWKILESRPRSAAGPVVVCIANQKGGVGKTTTAVNLAASLALGGHRILMVDCDPQANATTGLGIDHRSTTPTTYDVLLGRSGVAEAARPTEVANLDCVPASLDLAGAEIELVGEFARERKLAAAIHEVAAGYDLVVLDCPPSLGLLTVNALAATADVIVPVQTEYYALEGLGQLLETAERVRRALNPELRIGGFVLTMYDGRTNLSEQVAGQMRGHFGGLVFDTVIPRSVRLSEAPSYGEPVVTLDPGARGSEAYRRLAGEVVRRYGLSAPGPKPGPGGRGYGTVSPEPPGIDSAWPPRPPWGEAR